ncbi:phage tail protein [Bacillus massiliigorillae]|uniref:phage tail protein n=1 Tax=Bacillus massiliigorillae TaxID=1243664 RepID=UPI0003AA0D28|nr:phage tail protein [Bacillus massiliigorillae]
MIVTHLDGRSEMLTDYTTLQRKRRVNGEYSLSFLLFQTERNTHSFDLVVEESLLEYDSQLYRIKKMTEKMVGNAVVKQIEAFHTFFDLVDFFQYGTITNTQTLSTCLAFALEGTGYTYEVVDSFSSAVFESFGNDNSLALVQKAINVFGAEVSINKKHLKFYQQVGRDTDIQFRFKHNVKTIEKYVDTSNLSTVIKGFGKKNEDGSYVTMAEYLSPMWATYGKRHAKPVYDERYTIQSELLARIKSELIDKPQVSFKIDGIELLKLGVNTSQVELGDSVFVIYEPLNIDITSRVMEIVDFPESNQSAQYTFENFRNNLTDTIADFQKTKDNMDAILNGEQKLPYNVLDDAVIRATEALKSAQTELIFENGIIAVDPTDPDKMVWLNSKGIGISVDGGKSFKEAITADGFVLSAGAIGQLAANNITVGPGTNFYNSNYDPTIANSKASQAQQNADNALAAADQVEQTVNVWKYPNTTMINGGSIRTNTIDVNRLVAGTLIGFTITTSPSTSSPRMLLQENKLTSQNGSSSIIIDSSDTTNINNSYPLMTFNTNGQKGYIGKLSSGAFYIMSYGNNIVLSANEVEMFAKMSCYNADVGGSLTVNGDSNVKGTKNASVLTSIGYVNVSAYETAEYYFGDIGRGKVVNGECAIEIESLFKETVNTDIDYEVFLTPYGLGQIYVDLDSMTPYSFVIKGDDIHFAYEIKAKRKGYETTRLELTHESEVDEIEG